MKLPKINWPWNKGILSYEEVRALRDTLSTKEYNDLVFKSLEYKTLWDIIAGPYRHLWYLISEGYWNFKTYIKNIYRFRKILSSYEGWDFGYDLAMLQKMYEIKVQSFEIGKEYFVGGDKVLKEIREIYDELTWLVDADNLDPDYIKRYKAVFKRMQKSYEFWW